jgi:hypothetical protein
LDFWFENIPSGNPAWSSEVSFDKQSDRTGAGRKRSFQNFDPNSHGKKREKMFLPNEQYRTSSLLIIF